MLKRDVQRYNLAKTDWGGFTHDVSRLTRALPVSDINGMAVGITNAIQYSAALNIPRYRGYKLNKPLWWNHKLSVERRELHRIRRKTKFTNHDDSALAEYKAKRNIYLNSPRSAKMNQWCVFSESLNQDRWDKAFKWLKTDGHIDKKLYSVINSNGSEMVTIKETINAFLEKFVPSDSDRTVDSGILR